MVFLPRPYVSSVNCSCAVPKKPKVFYKRIWTTLPGYVLIHCQFGIHFLCILNLEYITMQCNATQFNINVKCLSASCVLLLIFIEWIEFVNGDIFILCFIMHSISVNLKQIHHKWCKNRVRLRCLHIFINKSIFSHLYIIPKYLLSLFLLFLFDI